MALQYNIKYKLDLRQTARIVGRRIISKSVNYQVDYLTDPGSLIVANNSGQLINFTLPYVEQCNGHCYSFMAGNTGIMMVSARNADTMVTLNDVAADAVNYGYTNYIAGSACDIWSDGTKYYHMDKSPVQNAVISSFVVDS